VSEYILTKLSILEETNAIKMNATQPVNTLNQVNECPICMDAIDGLCNKVVTECGHAFHCSCLMQNAAHNGFGCPYCRTTMAETPAAEEDDEDDYSEEEESILDDDALTSFRMFHQRINGEEVEEEEAEEWESVDEDEDEDDTESMPDAAYMAQKLVERGITFEDLVKHILFEDHSHFGVHYSDYERRSSEVYGQFRAAISQFRPNQATPIPTPAPTPVASSDSASAIPASADPVPAIPLPEVAEAKSVSVFHRREFMMHV
jgi:hypothetical protein